MMSTTDNLKNVSGTTVTRRKC